MAGLTGKQQGCVFQGAYDEAAWCGDAARTRLTIMDAACMSLNTASTLCYDPAPMVKQRAGRTASAQCCKRTSGR